MFARAALVLALILSASTLDAQPADRFITVNGLRIHYLEWGDPANDPLLLVHGIGRIAHTYDPIAPAFTDRYRVLAIDMRGHGDSDWSPDGAYTVHDYTSDIQAMAEALDLRNIVISGNSTGGRVAQLFAGLEPDRVAAVIVEDVGPERPLSIANRLAVQIEREDASGWASVEALIGELESTNRRTQPDVLGVWARFGSKTRDDGRVVWKRDPAIGNDFVPLQHWPYVGRITAPVMYVLGGSSTIVPAETVAELRRVLPQVRIITMPGLGHYPGQEEPDNFVAIVKGFLGSLR